MLPQFSPGFKVDDILALELVDVHGGRLGLQLGDPLKRAEILGQLVKSWILRRGIDHLIDIIPVFLLVNDKGGIGSL